MIMMIQDMEVLTNEHIGLAVLIRMQEDEDEYKWEDVNALIMLIEENGNVIVDFPGHVLRLNRADVKLKF